MAASGRNLRRCGRLFLGTRVMVGAAAAAPGEVKEVTECGSMAILEYR